MKTSSTFWPSLLCVAFLSVRLQAEQPAEKPLPKWVLTHTMGMMPATGWWGANGLFPLTDFAKSRPPDMFTKIYGGQYRALPLGFLHCFTKRDGTYDFNDPFVHPLPARPELSVKPEYLADPYRWDLEWAERMGVDGFGLLLSGNEVSKKHAIGWFKAMEAMLREKPDTNLRITLMFSGHDLPTDGDPGRYQWMRDFAAEYKDSPAWLRHNGRIVLMGYRSMMTWDAKEGVEVEQARQAVAAHQRFLKSLGLGDPIFVFDGTEYVPGDISYPLSKPDPQLLAPVAEEVCKTFDGYMVWGGVIPDEIYQRNYPVIADAVNRSGKAWGMPIINIHSGIGQFYISRPGVERLLDTWNFAEKTGAQLAQIVTWNDSNEATSFVPSTSLNYAFTSLNAKLAHRFKHGKFPEAEEDSVYLFYRKYHPDADPYLYPRATVERDRSAWGETDDMLHVIVFAKEPGTIKISGTSEGTVERELQKGFNEFKLKTAIDREIAARIYRDGALSHELVSPERVTDRPYREDLIPWGWSSDCRKYYDLEFGKNFRPISYYSQRYNDGIPDWFRLHYFGTTELPKGGLPGDDPDGDGMDNLQEFLLGEDPTQPNPVYAPGYVWDEWRQALSVVTDQPYTDRINQNPYPDKNGKLVHAFLYQRGGELDGRYPHMNKWHNKRWNDTDRNSADLYIGWSLRHGSARERPGYYLAEGDDRMVMNLPPDYAGIYRFWSPVAGQLRYTCTVTGDPEVPVNVYIKRGREELFAGTCEAGKKLTADVTLKTGWRDRIDFIVKPTGSDRASVTMEPKIEKRP
jgi:hypothetical protein